MLPRTCIELRPKGTLLAGFISSQDSAAGKEEGAEGAESRRFDEGAFLRRTAAGWCVGRRSGNAGGARFSGRDAAPALSLTLPEKPGAGRLRRVLPGCWRDR